MSSSVIEEQEDVRSVSLSDVPPRPTHSTLVLVEPSCFDRRYVINPYMRGIVDRDRARAQWEELRSVYEDLVDDLRVFDPAKAWETLRQEEKLLPPEGLPDMVFVANHALPTADGDEVILARLSKQERAQEPRYFRAWAEAEGYRVHDPPAANFEGLGDARWHPGRRLLWGGYGVRSDRAAYDDLAQRLDATVVPLELVDEHYYHLDVCFTPLSESTVLIQPDAFTPESLTRIESVFERVLEAPAVEATSALSVNAEVVGDTVVLGTGAPRTCALLEDAGFDVVQVDTSEFLKAGGSVCCLTLPLGTPA